MAYIWQSVKTWSYWKYAVLSEDGVKTFFAVLGGGWMLFEICGFFNVLDAKNLPPYTIYLLFVISFLVVVFTRRPVNRIRYKLSGKDLSIEVRIGNLFDMKGQKVISTNTTFDTDLSSGIIAAESLQGQFTKQYYPQSIGAFDTLISQGLANEPFIVYNKISGKSQKYPLGTTIRINIGSEVFYLLAMSDLNFNNTAQTTLENVMTASEALFEFISQKGETSDIVVPLVGTGRGRITTNRKRVIARIAQTFIRASEQHIFSNKLIIVVHPKDAENFGINLYEVRDLLNHYLP